MARIFVSYRRNDSKHITGHIFENLESYFGQRRVFRDIDNIPVGNDYRIYVNKALTDCELLVAIVGSKWKEELDAYSKRGGQDPDWVRLEIAVALDRQIPIVPVLIDDTKMPGADDLPDDLREFAYRQAARFDSEDFKHYMQRLISLLQKITDANRPSPPQPTYTYPRPNQRDKLFDRSRNIFAAKMYVALGVLGFSFWLAKRFADWPSGTVPTEIVDRTMFLIVGVCLFMLVVTFFLIRASKRPEDTAPSEKSEEPRPQPEAQERAKDPTNGVTL